MAKINKTEETPLQKVINDSDIRELQRKLMPYKQKKIDGEFVSRFYQYMMECKILIYRAREWYVADPYSFKWYSEIEDARLKKESWLNQIEGMAPRFDLKAARPKSLVKKVFYEEENTPTE